MNNKQKYGEVFTPQSLVLEIYELLYPLIKNKTTIDLYEPGVGKGIFYNNYDKTLLKKTNYYGCEINKEYTIPCSTIIHGDFFDLSLNQYDVILGNLPFNNNGFINVPCSKNKIRGRTIWTIMLKKCIEHLKKDGFMAVIIPCIWLKPDKEHIYETITNYKIQYLKIYSSSESNKLFKYECQTPICYVIFQKSPSIHKFKLYDNNKFIDFELYSQLCIPTKNARLLYKSILFMKERPHIKNMNVIKIACMRQNIIDSENKNDPYVLTSSILENKKLIVKGFNSKVPGDYYNCEKIILSHKRLPIPIYDKDGLYSIYGRDKYIFVGETLELLYTFLSLPMIQTLILSFIIRMNFYEKYIFDYIPDPRTFINNDYKDYLYLLEN